ncbi:hypothetical protein [Planctomycetes bacterium K23_9]|uniref:Uncharacterized protein n=1 Tax=Stieleria marina TaxID=1930275 RepID=A0A517NUJ4_9BACT|nr:hypothetical protein K239x_27900 [Planctomycetes bacterium K23_9]
MLNSGVVVATRLLTGFNYKAAAEILADIREAVGDEAGKQLAHDCAKKIVKAHTTLNMLQSSLRKRGLLD